MNRLAPALLVAVATAACGTTDNPRVDAGLDANAADASALDANAADAPALDAPDASRVRDLTFTPPDPSRVVEPGVRREVFRVDAPAPAENPATHVATPGALDAVQVLRYRQDVSPPAPVRAVVVAMPGFLGCAGTFDTVARALVLRGAAAGGIEVWALDRRSNLLEDLQGMLAADAMSDPEIAHGYYLDRTVSLNGSAFAGFLAAQDPTLAYMSEWGLATTLNDLRAVITRVPSPRDHVILLGHSLGGSIVESYDAWDFAGEPGFASVAGTVLVDGALSGTAVTESEYHSGSASAPGGFPAPGVDSVRAGGPYYFVLPLLGLQAEIASEISARRALVAPDAVVRDAVRDRVLKTLLGIAVAPPLTNAAAFGFGVDNGSNPLGFAQMSVGTPGGGPLMTQPDSLGQGATITVPASRTDTYIWLDAPAGSATEFTPLASAANCWAAGPTNFPEWYFPVRLPVDVTAVGDAHLAADSWQASEGLRAFHGGENDAPMLVVGTYFYPQASAFDGARARLAPAVGAGRPAAGATRDDPQGYRALVVPGMTHLDPLSGADGNPNNPVPEALATFALANTVGSVSLTP